MVDAKTIQKQLKRIKFSGTLWNQAELRELPKIIHEDEEISECVNGFYEGGVALLVATEMRVLLIDKKPLNYLTVEDLRFDMINEIDYNHRLMGASITISTGGKTLKFSSLNQPRLRHLIGLVQEHMSNGKKQQAEKADNQQQHLEEINKQLQMYLLAQHQHLQRQAAAQNIEPLKPDPELSDYLFAQRLLEKFRKDGGTEVQQQLAASGSTPPQPEPAKTDQVANEVTPEEPTAQPITQEELVRDARQEVFGRQLTPSSNNGTVPAAAPVQPAAASAKGLEINPLRIAYSRLPMMLRNRRFGRPSFHAHSEQQSMPTGQTVPSNT